MQMLLGFGCGLVILVLWEMCRTLFKNWQDYKRAKRHEKEERKYDALEAQLAQERKKKQKRTHMIKEITIILFVFLISFPFLVFAWLWIMRMVDAYVDSQEDKEKKHE